MLELLAGSIQLQLATHDVNANIHLTRTTNVISCASATLSSVVQRSTTGTIVESVNTEGWYREGHSRIMLMKLGRLKVIRDGGPG